MLKKFIPLVLAFTFIAISCDQNGPALDFAISSFIKSGMFFSEKTVYTISYSEGYNINFEITEEQAASLLPDNITPIPIKILESEPERKYYISMYLAVMENSNAMGRVDMFTYGRDQNDEMTMFFIAGIIGFPDFVKGKLLIDSYKMVLEYFARDSRTGEPSYPHYWTDFIAADSDTFSVKLEDAENSEISLDACSPPISTDERFSMDFVLVNSQIYRNDIDKNVNYFNQSFINAKVETRDLDCLTINNLSGFHPMLSPENLRSVQFYGSKDKQVTWYFEM